MRSRLLATSLLLGFASSPVSATDISCRVTEVVDGDAFTCLTATGKPLNVRLAGVDAPEARQPHGDQSRRMLSDLVLDQRVTLNVQEADRQGRSVAWAHTGTRDINAEMVSQGGAWVRRPHDADRRLALLESQAEADKRGLWALAEAERVPPWEWRALGWNEHPAPHTVSPGALAKGPAASGLRCDGKRFCKEMNSCDEAKFYVENCGPRSLDGDRDGVPCESLCK
ncbi:thermonuclease family protein [Azotobacter salinestris]|uniref:thermonuclease family protein n=1 Tax=Azotobacter salinestris TaxID=69964 RepID=UPI0032DF5190